MQDIFTLTKNWTKSVDQFTSLVAVTFGLGSCWWNTGHYTLHFGTLHKRTYCNKHYTSLHYLALHYSRLHHVLILSKHFQSFYHYFTSAFPLIIDLLPRTCFLLSHSKETVCRIFHCLLAVFLGDLEQPFCDLTGMMVNLGESSPNGLRFQLFNHTFQVSEVLCWFGGDWNMNFMTFHILGMSSSQLTKSIIFQRGRYTTNQYASDNPSLILNIPILWCYAVSSPKESQGSQSSPWVLTRKIVVIPWWKLHGFSLPNRRSANLVSLSEQNVVGTKGPLGLGMDHGLAIFVGTFRKITWPMVEIVVAIQIHRPRELASFRGKYSFSRLIIWQGLCWLRGWCFRSKSDLTWP